MNGSSTEPVTATQVSPGAAAADGEVKKKKKPFMKKARSGSSDGHNDAVFDSSKLHTAKDAKVGREKSFRLPLFHEARVSV